MAASEKRSLSAEHDQHTVEHIDSAIKDEKPVEQDEKRDWTGTTRKTDPEEIKLVRKLDYRIMVSDECHEYCCSDLLTTPLEHSQLFASCTFSVSVTTINHTETSRLTVLRLRRP